MLKGINYDAGALLGADPVPGVLGTLLMSGGICPPLMAAAVIMLFAGLWEGLVYLGLSLPAGGTTLHDDHGQLMVLGFLGTLIAVERAAALGSRWAYLAPAAAGRAASPSWPGHPADSERC